MSMPTEDVTGLIGRSVSRPNARRLVAGRGTYTDDITLPGMVHLAFLRSPFSRARIKSIDVSAALDRPGVAGVFTGRDIASICQAWQAGAGMAGFKSAPQYPLAVDIASWQGEGVVAIAAETRALAEDAIEHVFVDWDELRPTVDAISALASDAVPLHGSLADNLALESQAAFGDVETAFATAPVVIEHVFDFERQTGVPLEPRGVLAAYNPAEQTLVVHQSHQTPFQMRDIYAQTLGLPEHAVRVVAPDVGGAFGIKLHAYPDEMAAVAISVLLGRPVKFIADRLESFVTDAHAREAHATARIAVGSDGLIKAFEADVVSGIGAYSAYPRTSIGEGAQAVQLLGAPYRFEACRTHLRVVHQNKTPTGAYRAVGQPIACTMTELLIDLAAEKLGLDPAEMRRRNYLGIEAGRTALGLPYEALSLVRCLDVLLERMDYDRLRREQAEGRARGVYRGIGLATFVEITSVGAGLYGPNKIRVAAHEGCTLRLEPSGAVHCDVSATDQGQGTSTGIAQIVADILALDMADIRVASGDTGAMPYGGGAWASRGISIGGEAAFLAASDLKANILAIAASMLQLTPGAISLLGGYVVDDQNQRRISLADLAELYYFRSLELPKGALPELTVTRHFVPSTRPFFLANGIQASHLEIDIETGFIRLLDHWVVEDCGRVINPLLVDEQIRGGVVQGLGGALLERCAYDDQAQFTNATMADYLVPMASEMPDIHVSHVETIVQETNIGAKGAGEAGTVGAGAAVWTAVHDALRPFGARIHQQPITPEIILQAIERAGH